MLQFFKYFALFNCLYSLNLSLRLCISQENYYVLKKCLNLHMENVKCDQKVRLFSRKYQAFNL